MKELDDIIKNNIKEINKIKKTYSDNKNSNLFVENKTLREQYKKIEEKFINDFKEMKLIKEDLKVKEFIHPVSFIIF